MFDAIAGLLAGCASIYAAIEQAKENEKELGDLMSAVKMVDAFLVRHNKRLAPLSEERIEVQMILNRIESIIKAIQHHFKKTTEDNSKVWNWYRSSDYADRMQRWGEGLQNGIQTLHVFVSRDFETDEDLAKKQREEDLRARGARSHIDPNAPVDGIPLGYPAGAGIQPLGLTGPDPKMDAVFQMLYQLQGSMQYQEAQVSKLMEKATSAQKDEFMKLYNQQEESYRSVVSKVEELAAKSQGVEMEEGEFVLEAAVKGRAGGLSPVPEAGDSVSKKIVDEEEAPFDVNAAIGLIKDHMATVSKNMEVLGADFNAVQAKQMEMMESGLGKAMKASTETILEAQKALGDDLKLSVAQQVEKGTAEILKAQRSVDDQLLLLVNSQENMEKNIVQALSESLKNQLGSVQEELADQIDKLGNDMTSTLSVINQKSHDQIQKVQDVLFAQSEKIEESQAKWYAEMKGDFEAASKSQATTTARLSEQMDQLVKVGAKHETIMKEQSAQVAIIVGQKMEEASKDWAEDMQNAMKKVLAESTARLQKHLDNTIITQTERVLEKQEELKQVVIAGNERVEKELRELKALISETKGDRNLDEACLKKLLPFVPDDLRTYYKRVFESLSILAGDGETVVPFADIFMPCKFQNDACLCMDVNKWFKENHSRLNAPGGTQSLICIIEGAAGLGKTTFAKFMVREQYAPSGFVTLFVDLGRARAEIEDRRRRGQTVAVNRELFIDLALSAWEQFYQEGSVTSKFQHMKQALESYKIQWIFDGFDEVSTMSVNDPTYDVFKTGMDRTLNNPNQYGDFSMFVTRNERQGTLRLPAQAGESVVHVKMRKWCRFDALDYTEKYFAALANQYDDDDDSWVDAALPMIRNCISAGTLALWDGVPLMYDIICGFVSDNAKAGKKAGPHCPWGLLTYAVESMYNREKLRQAATTSMEGSVKRSLVSLEETVRAAAKFAEEQDCQGGDFLVDLKKDDEWSVARSGFVVLSNQALDVCHHDSADTKSDAGSESASSKQGLSSEASTSTLSEGGAPSPRGGAASTSKQSLAKRIQSRQKTRKVGGPASPRRGAATGSSHFTPSGPQRYRFHQSVLKDYFFAWKIVDDLAQLIPTLDGKKAVEAQFKTLEQGMSKIIKKVLCGGHKSAMSLSIHGILFKKYHVVDGNKWEVGFWTQCSFALLKAATEEMLHEYKEKRKECAACLSALTSSTEDREKWRQILKVHPVVEALMLFHDYETPADYFNNIFKTRIWLPVLFFEPMCRFGQLSTIQSIVKHMTPDQITPNLLKSAMLSCLGASQKFQLIRQNHEILRIDDSSVYDQDDDYEDGGMSFVDIADDTHSDVLAIEYLRSIGASVSIPDCVSAGQHLFIPEVVERGGAEATGCKDEFMEGLAIATNSNQIDCLETLIAIMEELYDESIYLGKTMAWGFTKAHQALNEYILKECTTVHIRHPDGLRYLLRLTEGGKLFVRLKEVDLIPMLNPTCSKWVKENADVPGGVKVEKRHLDIIRDACPPGVVIRLE